MPEIKKRSIRDYFFVAIGSIALGLMLLIIGGIFAGINSEGFWDSISKSVSVLLFSGWLCILLLPILSWYTIYTKDVTLGDYISKLTGGTIFFVVLGIIFVIVGSILEGFDWREGFLGLIFILFKMVGSFFNFVGFLLFIFSPIISWYGFQTDFR